MGSNVHPCLPAFLCFFCLAYRGAAAQDNSNILQLGQETLGELIKETVDQTLSGALAAINFNDESTGLISANPNSWFSASCDLSFLAWYDMKPISGSELQTTFPSEGSATPQSTANILPPSTLPRSSTPMVMTGTPLQTTPVIPSTLSTPTPIATTFLPGTTALSSTTPLPTTSLPATTPFPSPSRGGKVLAVGSFDTRTAEVYNSSVDIWTPVASTAARRAAFQMVLLPSGNVLAAGTIVNSGQVYGQTAEVYNSSANTWTTVAPMQFIRYYFQMLLLPSGKVLAAGGSAAPQSAEVYDPSADTWTMVKSMSYRRFSFQMVLLPSGKVLAAGTAAVTGTQGEQQSAEVYDPSVDTWTTVGSMAFPRNNIQMVLLPSGKVLAAGGAIGNLYTAAQQSAEVYDPSLGNWTTVASMLFPRSNFEMVLLPNGKILAAGGLPLNSIYTAEVYDPSVDTWTMVASMKFPRASFQMVLLPSGKVFAVGSSTTTEAGQSAEVYDPSSGNWTTVASMASPRNQFQMVLL